MAESATLERLLPVATNEMPSATDDMIVNTGGRPQPASHTASMDTNANLRQIPKLREAMIHSLHRDDKLLGPTRRR